MMKKSVLTVLILLGIIIVQSQSREQIVQEQKKEIDSLKVIIIQLTKDSDQDGISDYFDKELDTPKGARVDGSGKSLDMDLDGIYDLWDRCVLESGIAALQGCPEDSKEWLIEIEPICSMDNFNIQFKYKEIQLSNEVKEFLKCTNHNIQKYRKSEKFYIESSSNDYPSDRKNLKISEKRAQLVIDYLIQLNKENKNIFVVKPLGNTELLYPECKIRANCDKEDLNWKNDANNRITFVMIGTEKMVN